ncbi:MAG: S8 family serine peptidase [Deltaproteobacteria bacterium]|nr:S8 family serine peptidase [Deltaproteobacteria bacterium]
MMLLAFALSATLAAASSSVVDVGAAPGPAAPSPDARFLRARAYRSAGRAVPVLPRADVLLVRLPPATTADAVAALVEERALGLALADGSRAADHVLVASARRVRPHGLFLVELAAPAPRAALALVATDLAGVTDGVWPALGRQRGRAFADDRLVVTAAPGRLQELLPALLSATGGRLVRRSPIPDTALIAVGAPFAHDAVDASAALDGTPGLIAAEPDLYRELAPRAAVDDPRFPEQWHLSHDPSIPGVGEVFADDAWDLTMGDPSVVIAVFDTGIDVDHPDLAANMDAGFDAAGDDDDPRAECSMSFDGRDVAAGCPDEAPYRESHGTSVSGTIAAVANNGLGVAGVCPGCRIMPVRLLGDEAASGLSIAEAFTRAVDEGAAAINNSWGPGFSLYFPLSTAERGAFQHARSAGRGGLGTVILFAAGNETRDVAIDAYAADPSVIAVAATTNLDDWAPYSSYGPAVDVAAPSQGLPAEQDGVADDDAGIVCTDYSGDNGYDAGDYNPGFSGTSASSPVTAGVVGLVLSTNPGLTAEQVRLVLTRSADKITADKMPWADLLGEDQALLDQFFGYDDNGHSLAFGYGRVNAARAVAIASDPGVAGGPCDAPGCTFCSAAGVCLDRCDAQDDCADGSVCDVALGACELPRDRPGDFLSPCTSDCAYCTATADTELNAVEICTVACGADDECPDGFDCRLTEPGGPSICSPGDLSAGEPNDFFACFSGQIGAALVGVSEEGRELCSDLCFGDAPGACPWGFSCVEADCDCTAESNWGCFQYACHEAVGAPDFPFPLCLPNAGFADVCESDLDCQRGDYCHDGRCQLDDRAGCDICKTCASDEDCAGRGACIGLSDDGIGQCAWACGDADPCPGDSACREVNARRGTVLVCLSPEGGVDEVDRCDPGYQCAVACRDDVPCAEGLVCNEGACEEPPPDDDPPDIGGSCLGCAQSEAAPAALGLVALAWWRRRRRASCFGSTESAR